MPKPTATKKISTSPYAPTRLRPRWRRTLKELTAEFDCWRSALELAGRSARAQLDVTRRNLQVQLSRIRAEVDDLEGRGSSTWRARAPEIDAAIRNFGENLDSSWQSFDQHQGLDR